MKYIDFDINKILYKFPYKKFNINNHNISNKNLFDISNKLFVLKPIGKKAYLWFTYYKKTNICILCLINDKINSINNQYYYFDINFTNNLLFNNVLIYGYYLNKDKNNYFIIDNIGNYNNLNNIVSLSTNDFKKKIDLYYYICNNIFNKTNYFVKLPYIADNIDILYKSIYNIEYNIHSIAIYNDIKYIGYVNYFNNKLNLYNQSKNKNFYVKPDIINDIYYLYNNKHDKNYSYIALIDSYKTSVFMNNIFRNIKENKNLDLLEESDDEDEFENTQPDKFVDISKVCYMTCSYNNKFKKYVPIKLL